MLINWHQLTNIIYEYRLFHFLISEYELIYWYFKIKILVIWFADKGNSADIYINQFSKFGNSTGVRQQVGI